MPADPSNQTFANVRELLEARVAEHRDKTFLISEKDNHAWTYGEFDARVNQTANLLRSIGAGPGDRVSLFLTNSIEYLLFYFACFKLGSWAGPINALLKPKEAAFVLQDSESVVAVTEPGLMPVLGAAAESAPALKHVILVGDVGDAAENANTRVPVVPYEGRLASQSAILAPTKVRGEDEAIIIYTSGTTGKPKGVLLTHRNLLTNAREMADWLKLTGQDRSLMIMPLFHVNALMTTGLAALWAGGSIVLASRFSASRHWEMIARHQVTYFGSVATMLSMLCNTYPEGVPPGLDISTLRFALCGSAPVPVEVLKRFEALFHRPVIEGYGLSESTCRSTFNPVDQARRPGSIGLPIGNEIKIFDEKDQELAAGQPGEIVLRGANIMKGYYHNEPATIRAFRSGWFHTGDIGYRDQDGFFHIVDRKSDMIIRAGENIYPREIDEVLYQHPAVREAATVGVPDPLYGESVKSFVALRDGQKATEGELIEFCKQRLADFKCPAAIAFMDELPKGPTGKLLKRELTDKSE